MYSELLPSPSRKRLLINKLITLTFNLGLSNLGRQIWAHSLTVLNYHRIDDPYRLGFDTFKPNVSARINDFDAQMEYLSQWFNVISMKDIVGWINGEKGLPPYAALITFDDGYLDNYTNAYPVLRKYNFPAVIYLTTNHIDSDTPFYWDLAGYCFYHTKQDHIAFPDGSVQSWGNSIQCDEVCKSWIEALKSLPNPERQAWVIRLPDLLSVSIPQNFFRNLMMNWDQIREMHENGIEFGGHTMNHPILSRVPLEEASNEITGSKDRIEQELGESIFSFAYPNGMPADVNSNIEKLVAGAGYKAAFTLSNGPSTLKEVKGNLFEIRRIFISHLHTLPQYALLTNRINRYRN